MESKSRVYRQVARASAQQRTRSALLEAAADEFFKGVWEQASLEGMATRANVTKQTLLRHFGSKDGLMEQALLHGRAKVQDQRWAAPTDNVEGAVENLLDHYAEWGERALLLVAREQSSPLVAAIAQQGRELHYEWVERVFGRWLVGLSRQARQRRRAALIALCDVHTWWLLSHDLDLPRRQVQATLTETIRRVIGDET